MGMSEARVENIILRKKNLVASASNMYYSYVTHFVYRLDQYLLNAYKHVLSQRTIDPILIGIKKMNDR
ncbi:hypothetical protein RB195_012460 [Necator americanus]|uniref:Uncharacterized protein n=1 Tax=Necator americanus TaxID=51031 RepID=A0ABR1D8Z1_NECAM